MRKLQRVAQVRWFRVENPTHAKAVGAIVDRVLVCGEKTTTRKWLTLAERWLAADPTSVSGFRMLGEAARAVELMRRTSIAQTVTEESCGDEGTFRRKVKTGSGATAYSRNSS